MEYRINGFKKAELPWLKEGLSLMAFGGNDSIRVEQMSKNLSISRTSFYHLFTSKSNFKVRLCEYWVYTATFHYIDQLSMIESSENKLINLARLIAKDEEGGKSWIRFKGLGSDNEEIKQLVEHVESKRVEFVSGLLQDIGYNLENSIKKAQIFMFYYIGRLLLQWPEQSSMNLTDDEIIELYASVDIDIRDKG